ncbi:unnamed protein product [Ectocarpus sp. 6 AP-2014]
MLEMLLILLLGLCALLDTSAGGWVGGWVGSSDIGEYHRCNGSSFTVCSLPRSWPSLGIHRDLTYNELTTLPEGIFGGLTALEYLTQTLQTHRAHETSSPNECTFHMVVPSLPSCSDHFSDPRFTHNGSSVTVCSLPRSWPSLGIHRNLTYNELTTLPEGIFGGLTALERLDLTYNELTILPDGIFGGLTALEYLELSYNELTTLPEGIFGGLTALERLRLYSNELTTLPEEIFGGLTALERLSLSNNELTTLPEGLFGGLTALELLWLLNNSLTTLPDGIFQGLPALTTLWLDGNSLECLPSTTLVEVDDSASFDEPGLHVDEHGDECGCSIEGVIDNMCGQETCTPGDEGYTCAATLAPVPAPALGTAAPESAQQPTPVPDSSPEAATLVPVAAPAPGTPAPESSLRSTPVPSSSSEGASTVEIVVGVVAGALAVAALGFFLRRRRAAKSTDPDPLAPASYGADSLECGRVKQHQQRQNDIHSSSPIMGDSTGGNVTRGPPPPAQQSSPPPPPSYVHNDAHRHDARPPAASQHQAVIAAETTFGGDDTPVQSLSTAPAMGALPKPSSEGKSKSTRDNSESGGGARTADAGRGGGDAAEDGSGCVAASAQSLLLLTTRNSAAEVSTEEGTAEVAEFGLSADAGGAPSAAALAPAAAAGDRRRTSSGVGCGQAVLAAAEKLAHSCQIPGISEAATAVSILIRLVLDSRDLTSSPGVKRCRSIVVMLERASKGGDTSTEEERVLMEEVHDAVSDLVELIKTYKNKSKVGKVLTSTLFKRRQGELNAVIDRAIWGLHLGLQVQVGHDVAHLVKRSTAEAQTESLAQVRAQAESLAEARRSRRQRKLDQIEIPEDHVSITDEMLGKGGFGVVYLADYNGHNAAAKVQHFTHGLGKPGENDIPLSEQRLVESNALGEKAERKAFLRELDAMIRLRSPHIVNIYGAITSLPDRLILVMELLAGGDLRAMLKNSEQPLPKDKCRQIIQDICVGMAFLHGKATVHGDLKSANILLDHRGRAKACWIGDFGTSRWAERSDLVTCNTKPGPSTHISFAWTAPEVLETKETSKAGDVYSFGMVAWEVLTRQTPWDQARPRDIYLGVVMREERPAIPAGALVDIAEMVRRCWAQEPKDRPTFRVLCNRGNVHRRLQAQFWGMVE